MFSLLLSIIYLTFISLGLPDAVLGSSWPIMYEEFNVPISYAGILSISINLCTIISSLFAGRLLKKFGTGLLTAISVTITAFALLGFSFSSSFFIIWIFTIPYGLGAGAIDASINNYAAVNYSAKHMNWLHSFWGVGATLGPIIMGLTLSNNFSWNSGYVALFIVQITLSIILFFSLPLWGESKKIEVLEEEKSYEIKELLKLKGAKEILIAFFCYCSLEVGTGLWSSTYLVLEKNLSKELSATLGSLFFLGITIGRFISGFLSTKVNSKNMIRLGEFLAFIGILLLALFSNYIFACVGLILIGLGCAPIYPSIIHETPKRFGKYASASMVGLQMACAYSGSTIAPPIIGFITENFGINLFPLLLLLILLIMSTLTEISNKKFT